jgi:hypothetical protein
MLINAEHYDFVLAPRLKKRIPMNLGSQFATLGANASAFSNILTNNLGLNNRPKILKVGIKFFQS